MTRTIPAIISSLWILLIMSSEADASGMRQVKIGNYFVDSPYGIAIIVDDATAFLIEPVWEEKGGKTKYSDNDAALVSPATAAPDFSFFQAVFRHSGAQIRFTWGRSCPGGVAGMLEADRPVAVSLRFPPTTWPQFHAIYTAAGDGLTGYGIKPDGDYVPFVFRSDPVPAKVNANIVSEAEIAMWVEPDRPVRFVAGVGGVPSLEDVEKTLKAAEIRYAARRITAEGDWGDFPGAIADNVNNSRLYGSDNQRIVHSCGRGWWLAHQKWFEGNADLFPYFLWDLFFHGVLAGFEDPSGARDTVRAVLSFLTPAGFVPSFSHWGAENNTYVTMHRSMPPVGSMCVWKMHQRHPDKAFLAEVYPRLVQWHDWWKNARDGNRNGLLEWGSEQHMWDSAQYETGWDDNVHFLGSRIKGTTMNADAVDLSSLWSMDAENLARIAAELGKTAEAERFKAEHVEMNRLINERLWNEKMGIYCSRLWEIPAVESPALDPQKVFKNGFETVFFRDPLFRQEAVRRRDSLIEFDWGRTSPTDGTPAEHWSARWTGEFSAAEKGRYRFKVSDTENVRLMFDGKVVETWTYESDGLRSFDIDLAKGEIHPVVLNYSSSPGENRLKMSVQQLFPGKPGSDWLSRLTPMNFYPLLCGGPDKTRAKRVLAWLYREDKFWLPWLIPTVAKDDPAWPEQHYWRGHIWPPANYLVWQGVKRYADAEHQVEFARRSVRLFMRNWNEERICSENYRSTDGKGSSHPHYTWGALLNLIGIEALADVDENFRPVPRKDSALTEEIVLHHIPFGGKSYRITSKNGTVTAVAESGE